MGEAKGPLLLDDNYAAAYSSMLDSVSERMPHRDLTAFWPWVGPDFEKDRDWLFVGQAVNRWGSLRDQGPRFGAGRPPRLEGAREYSRRTAPKKVEDYVQSPFWATVRWVVEDGDWKTGWSRRVAWSNLFKVAPWDGGNPDPALRAAQFDAARSLLREEIRCLQPTCVFVMAGIDWYEGFVDISSKEHARLSKSSPKPKIGKATPIDDVPIVLAPHPGAAWRSGWTGETLGQALLDASGWKAPGSRARE